MTAQCEVWWVDLGHRRPVLIVQSDSLNRCAISTVACVPLTSNLKWAAAPGNVALRTSDTGLPKESVANVSQIVAVDKAMLTERVGKIRKPKLDLVFAGIDIILGR